MDPYLERMTEPISRSIYGGSRTAHRPEDMRELLADPELSLSLKFTAILAAYAHLQFPLQFSAFRRLIPDSFWEEHARCGYNSYQGNVSIYTKADERHFILCIGPQSSPYDVHCVVMATTNTALFTDHSPRGTVFDPPLDTAISRYTLGHPFLKCELHEPDGRYLFKS